MAEKRTDRIMELQRNEPSVIPGIKTQSGHVCLLEFIACRSKNRTEIERPAVKYVDALKLAFLQLRHSDGIIINAN